MKKNTPPFNLYNRSHYWLGSIFPVEMHAVLHLTGKLNISLLKNALEHVVTEYPVLNSRIKNFLFFIQRKILSKPIDTDKCFLFKQSSSQRTKETTSHAFYIAGEELTTFINMPIDLHTAPPFRVLLLQQSTNTYTMAVKLNHTVTDGFGLYLFISKIFQKYNELHNFENKLTIPDEPVSYSIKKLKMLIDDKKTEKLQNIQKDKTTGKKISFLRDNFSLNSSIKTIVYELTKNEYQKIKKITSSTVFTVNDIYAYCCAQSIYQLIKKRNALKDILIFEQPINLRKDLDLKSGLSNYISLIKIILDENDFCNNNHLLTSIKEKTDQCITSKQYIKLAVNIPLIAHLVPSKFLKWLLKINAPKAKDKAFLTGSMSNLGKLDTLLETPYTCDIESVWTLVSPNFSLGLQWLASTYKEKMVINLIYSDPLISDNTALELLTIFKNELKKILTMDLK